ncbi:glycosidase [Natranaerovirga pectinivora]|uniref:Glycosidase n=1 Tax=Natranaerovirga pectinivora TaxID=682400 RepID=A0A4R3MQB3_9FIRM|nr:glycoside hydrolase family 13 protein [Natranaerovirga pectinivora]TCT15361.1 glycosidase [Natranaerovirga pectinivora]
MINLIYYNSQDKYYKDPFGAVECGTVMKLRIKINTKNVPDSVYLRLWEDNEEKRYKMTLDKEYEDSKEYVIQIKAPKKPSLIWYYFIVILSGEIFYYGNNDNNFGGVGLVGKTNPKSYQITVYKTNSTTPNWFKEAIMYQIFVDRFYNGNENNRISNPKKESLIHPNWNDTPIYIKDQEGGILRWDFFGGNLLGIIKKLKYLKELGISVIYLNPIFEAESNHKYDTGDYKKVDPMFGDDDILKELCVKADALGIKVILDGVFSHTGSNSIYFNKEGQYDSIGAYQSKESKYYKWYRFNKYPDHYDCWWGVHNLPNVNEMEDSYLDYIIRDKDSVLKKWVNLGIKGWRLDVADELPEGFLKLFYKTLKEVDEESILIGEVWEDASNKESYGETREYLLGDDLDSVMNYPLRNAVIDFALGKNPGDYTMSSIMSLIENYPIHNLYAAMNHISNHDLPRIITVIKKHISNQDIEFKILKLITLFQLTFPGIPSIYYGDEAGVEGGTDPENRKTFPWGNEDLDIYNWYKNIIALRNGNDVLKTGGFKPLYSQGNVLSYMRFIENEKDPFGNIKENGKIIIILNRAINNVEEFELEIDSNKEFVDVFTKNRFKFFDNKAKIILQPLEYKVLKEEC